MISTQRIESVLGITRDEAKQVRAILEMKLHRGERTGREADSPEYELHHDSASRKLYMIDRLLSGYHGVEIIRSADDTYSEFRGISYLNAGESYAATIMYDHGKGKWMLGSWGDIVERQERRFAE